MAKIMKKAQDGYMAKIKKSAESNTSRKTGMNFDKKSFDKLPALKTKAKDGKWIQKAVNPAHKGYCTPMSKPTCTPKRKALAKTLKKIAKNK